MSEYEPITAELRRVMNHTTMAGVPLVEIGEFEFGHRCDAIDAVHAGLERENAELRERVTVLDNERGNMHDDWIRLPLDADGVPINVRDVVVEVDEPDVPRTVTSVTFAGDGWWVYINGVGRRSDKYRHHRAPTVEDVLREMHAELDEVTALYVGEAIDSDERDRDEARIFAEYSAKLRLAEGE